MREFDSPVGDFAILPYYLIDNILSYGTYITIIGYLDISPCVLFHRYKKDKTRKIWHSWKNIRIDMYECTSGRILPFIKSYIKKYVLGLTVYASCVCDIPIKNYIWLDMNSYAYDERYAKYLTCVNNFCSNNRFFAGLNEENFRTKLPKLKYINSYDINRLLIIHGCIYETIKIDRNTNYGIIKEAKYKSLQFSIPSRNMGATDYTISDDVNRLIKIPVGVCKECIEVANLAWFEGVNFTHIRVSTLSILLLKESILDLPRNIPSITIIERYGYTINFEELKTFDYISSFGIVSTRSIKTIYELFVSISDSKFINNIKRLYLGFDTIYEFGKYEKKIAELFPQLELLTLSSRCLDIKLGKFIKIGDRVVIIDIYD